MKSYKCFFCFLTISILFYSCKTDYEKDIIGVWWLDKIDTTNNENVRIAGNEIDTMYYEFMNNNSERYTSSLGLSASTNYSLSHDTLNSITFMTTALIANNLTLKSDRKYKILKLNQSELIVKSENPNEPDNGVIYYFKRTDTTVLVHLKMVRQKFTEIQESAKFKKFKEGFANDRRALKVSMDTYDKFIHCVFDKVFKELNEKELRLLEEHNSDTLLQNKIKIIDKDCAEAILKPNMLY